LKGLLIRITRIGNRKAILACFFWLEFVDFKMISPVSVDLQTRLIPTRLSKKRNYCIFAKVAHNNIKHIEAQESRFLGFSPVFMAIGRLEGCEKPVL